MAQYAKYKEGGLRQKIHKAIRAEQCIRCWSADHLRSSCPEPPKKWEDDYNKGKDAFWAPKRNGRMTIIREKMPFGPQSYPSLALNGFALHPPILPRSSCPACCWPEIPTWSSPWIPVAMFLLVRSNFSKMFDWLKKKFWSKVVALEFFSRWKVSSHWSETWKSQFLLSKRVICPQAPTLS
jgi:hypothetical protein